MLKLITSRGHVPKNGTSHHTQWSSITIHQTQEAKVTTSFKYFLTIMDLGKIECNWSPATLSKKDTHCARRLLKLTKHLLLLQPVLETKAKEELKGKWTFTFGPHSYCGYIVLYSICPKEISTSLQSESSQKHLVVVLITPNYKILMNWHYNLSHNYLFLFSLQKRKNVAQVSCAIELYATTAKHTPNHPQWQCLKHLLDERARCYK